jgi:hypothetical protein
MAYSMRSGSIAIGAENCRLQPVRPFLETLAVDHGAARAQNGRHLAGSLTSATFDLDACAPLRHTRPSHAT